MPPKKNNVIDVAGDAVRQKALNVKDVVIDAGIAGKSFIFEIDLQKIICIYLAKRLLGADDSSSQDASKSANVHCQTQSHIDNDSSRFDFFNLRKLFERTRNNMRKAD